MEKRQQQPRVRRRVADAAHQQVGAGAERGGELPGVRFFTAERDDAGCGELENMLSKVADFYVDEVDAAIQALTSIIEPIMMIGVGVMVGIIVIAMYLPMFKMLSLIE